MNRRTTGNERKRKHTQATARSLPVAAAAAVLCGVGVFSSFPNFAGVELPLLEWIALVPLLWAIDGASLRRAWWLGWLAGWVTNLGGFYWLVYLLEQFGHFSFVPSLLLYALDAAWQGLVFALFALGVRVLESRAGAGPVLAAPVAMVVAEQVVPFIFPWFFGNGQMRLPVVTQIADATGVSGITFVVVTGNAALWVALRAALAKERPSPLALTWAVLLVAGVLAYGAVRLDEVSRRDAAAPHLRVGIVEGDIGIWEKEAKHIPRELRVPTLRRNLVRHQRLSSRAVARGSQLVVWPESAYVPVGRVWTKRTDVFAVAGGDGGVVVERRGDEWVEVEPAAGRRIQAAWGSGETVWCLAGTAGMVRCSGPAAPQLADVPQVDFMAMTGSPPRGGRSPSLWLAAPDGAVWRWRRGAWTRLALPGGGRALALAWDPSRQRPVAVGTNGTAWVGVRGGWRAEETGVDVDLHGLTVTLDGMWVAVGEGGTVVVRSPEGHWHVEKTTATQTLRGAWASRDGAVWAVGDGGWMGRRSAHGRWRAVATGIRSDLFAVGGNEAGLVVAVGDRGVAVEVLGGGKPRIVEAPARTALRAVAAVGWWVSNVIPDDAHWLWKSRAPLPRGDDPRAIVAADRAVAERDRTTPLRGFDAPLFFGAITQRRGPHGERRIYNSTLLVDRRGKVLGRYHKNYLLAFGEYIPLGDRFPVFYKWLPEASHFWAGHDVAPIRFDGHRLGPTVCYEDIIARFVRKLGAQGTEVLVNITNDAWFGKTAEPWLHLALATFRTIETRQWLVRATNTGVSALVDPAGRIRAHTSLDDPEILVGDIALLDWTSPYERAGDAFLFGCVGLGAVLLGVAFARRAPRRGAARRRRAR